MRGRRRKHGAFFARWQPGECGRKTEAGRPVWIAPLRFFSRQAATSLAVRSCLGLYSLSRLRIASGLNCVALPSKARNATVTLHLYERSNSMSRKKMERMGKKKLRGIFLARIAVHFF